MKYLSLFILYLRTKSLKHKLLYWLVGLVVTERNTTLLFSGVQYNDHYDALLKIEEKERFGFLIKFVPTN
jgi:hypothetical protein